MAPLDLPTVEDHPDHVEARGVPRDVGEAALEIYGEVQAVRAEHVATNREQLVKALMASGIPLTPPASLAQAQRLAAHRDALQCTPGYAHATLSQMRGDAQESSTRTWLARRRDSRELFTLTHDGRTLIPAFQLDEHGRPRPELQPLLAVLVPAGVQGWTLWTWPTTPTGLLSGEVPEKLVQTNPTRALRAAQRFAERAVA